MTRTGLRAITTGTVAAVAISGAVLAGTPGASANDGGRQLTGTWQVTVEPYSGPSTVPFVSTIVYTATGSVVEATSRGPMSAGLGTWQRLGDGRFGSTVEKYRFNGAGAYVGRTVVEEVQEVAPSGDRYTGSATTTFYDVDGTRTGQLLARSTGVRR